MRQSEAMETTLELKSKYLCLNFLLDPYWILQLLNP